jgi:hypothetical protein
MTSVILLPLIHRRSVLGVVLSDRLHIETGHIVRPTDRTDVLRS